MIFGSKVHVTRYKSENKIGVKFNFRNSVPYCLFQRSGKFVPVSSKHCLRFSQRTVIKFCRAFSSVSAWPAFKSLELWRAVADDGASLTTSFSKVSPHSPPPPEAIGTRLNRVSFYSFIWTVREEGRGCLFPWGVFSALKSNFNMMESDEMGWKESPRLRQAPLKAFSFCYLQELSF